MSGRDGGGGDGTRVGGRRKYALFFCFVFALFLLILCTQWLLVTLSLALIGECLYIPLFS